jgi:hypothetical protein
MAAGMLDLERSNVRIPIVREESETAAHVLKLHAIKTLLTLARRTLFVPVRPPGRRKAG